MSALVACPLALEAGRGVGVRLMLTGKSKAIPHVIRFLAPLRGREGEVKWLSWKALLEEVVHVYVELLPSHALDPLIFHLELVSAEGIFE